MSFLKHRETHQNESNVKGRDLSATPYSLIVLMSSPLAIPGGLLSTEPLPSLNRRLLCNNVGRMQESNAGIRNPTLIVVSL